MRSRSFYSIILVFMALFTAFSGTLAAAAQEKTAEAAKNLAVGALLDRFDEGNGVVYVYRDFSNSLNHFRKLEKGRALRQHSDPLRNGCASL